MALSVRGLRDPSGDALPLYRAGVSVEAGAAVSATATLSASAAVYHVQDVQAAVSATATISASMASFVDISSLMVPGNGTQYDPGRLTIPGWDKTYTLTFATGSPAGSGTPGIAVKFTVPSSPNVAHSVTVHYNFGSRSGRFFSSVYNATDEARFEHPNGLVIEPSGEFGSSASITYGWDPATQTVTITGYSGSIFTRDHGPILDCGITVTFAPEVRADAHFADIYAWTESALLYAIPTDTRALLADKGVWIDVIQTSTPVKSLALRNQFNAAYAVGTSGQQIDRYIYAQRGTWSDPIQGFEPRVMLHELGHALDTYYLDAIGEPAGLDPRAIVVPYYWGDGVTLHYELFYRFDAFEPFRVKTYDESGVLVDDSTYPEAPPTTPRRLTGETGLYAIWPGGTTYYTSTVTEWFAQMCMLFWIKDFPGFNAAGIRNGLINEVGGTAVYNDFVSYMQGIGAFPT